MSNKDEPIRVCRKCLLREMKESEYFESLHAYIENLDEDLKVPSDVYEARLEKCKACDQLLSGMCRKCGCYVELRAILKKSICPHTSPRWLAQPEA